MLCKLGSGWRHTLASVLLALTTVFGLPAVAKTPNTADKPAETTIAKAQLPEQGQQVLNLIYQGGPFK
jgi:guanyl-specific ribonuclease Sa